MPSPTDTWQHAAHPLADRPAKHECEGVIAGYAIRRRLAPNGLAERYSATDVGTGAPALLYRLLSASIGVPEPDALRSLARLSTLRQRHLLSIDRVELGNDRSIWLVAAYPGSSSGLLALGQLLSQKPGGILAEREVHHVASHMLSALDAAHGEGFAHGSLRPDDVLVDPRGRTLIELLGVRRALAASPRPLSEARRADLRAVAAIAYELLTGVPSGGQRLPVPRALGRAARRWDTWIACTLDEISGFTDASGALARLP